ncbi:MAG: hypothetical protein ABL883_02745 [Terricaulis sp.]
MRALAISLAVLSVAALAAPASAQQDSLAGVWAFQSEPYGNEQFALTMSGAAVWEEARNGRYSIRLTANEIIVERASNRSRILTAHQNCTGERDGTQINVTCEMAEPLEGYTPDAFLLQDSDGALAGVLNTGPQVTFARVR